MSDKSGNVDGTGLEGGSLSKSTTEALVAATDMSMGE